MKLYKVSVDWAAPAVRLHGGKRVLGFSRESKEEGGGGGGEIRRPESLGKKLTSGKARLFASELSNCFHTSVAFTVELHTLLRKTQTTA